MISRGKSRPSACKSTCKPAAREFARNVADPCPIPPATPPPSCPGARHCRFAHCLPGGWAKAPDAPARRRRNPGRRRASGAAPAIASYRREIPPPRPRPMRRQVTSGAPSSRRARTAVSDQRARRPADQPRPRQGGRIGQGRCPDNRAVQRHKARRRLRRCPAHARQDFKLIRHPGQTGARADLIVQHQQRAAIFGGSGASRKAASDMNRSPCRAPIRAAYWPKYR